LSNHHIFGLVIQSDRVIDLKIEEQIMSDLNEKAKIAILL